jgi:hypothetical protein
LPVGWAKLYAQEGERTGLPDLNGRAENLKNAMQLEIVVAIAALLLAGASLWMVGRLRGDLERGQRALNAAAEEARQARQRAEDAERRVETLNGELQQFGEELKSLRAAAESPLPLKLPRARSSRLDDLREQLRAAQQEESDESEEP